MTTCSTSLIERVLLWAGIASALRMLGGNAASVAAAIPVWAVLWRNLRREVVMAVFQRTRWWDASGRLGAGPTCGAVHDVPHSGACLANAVTASCRLLDGRKQLSAGCRGFALPRSGGRHTTMAPTNAGANNGRQSIRDQVSSAARHLRAFGGPAVVRRALPRGRGREGETVL